MGIGKSGLYRHRLAERLDGLAQMALLVEQDCHVIESLCEARVDLDGFAEVFHGGVVSPKGLQRVSDAVVCRLVVGREREGAAE